MEKITPFLWFDTLALGFEDGKIHTSDALPRRIARGPTGTS